MVLPFKFNVFSSSLSVFASRAILYAKRNILIIFLWTSMRIFLISSLNILIASSKHKLNRGHYSFDLLLSWCLLLPATPEFLPLPSGPAQTEINSRTNVDPTLGTNFRLSESDCRRTVEMITMSVQHQFPTLYRYW